MENLALSWLANHQQFFIGIAAGWATAHVRIIVRTCFKAAMKIDALRELVDKYALQIRAMVDETRDELDEDITEQANADAEAKKNLSQAPPK